MTLVWSPNFSVFKLHILTWLSRSRNEEVNTIHFGSLIKHVSSLMGAAESISMGMFFALCWCVCILKIFIYPYIINRKHNWVRVWIFEDTVTNLAFAMFLLQTGGVVQWHTLNFKIRIRIVFSIARKPVFSIIDRSCTICIIMLRWYTCSAIQAGLAGWRRSLPVGLAALQ